jgi:hypothetical protein
VLDGNFHHVATVLNRANLSTAIYLDGVLQQTNAIGSLGGIANSGRLFIGHQSLDVPGTTGIPFNGVIDELSLYNRALTAAELQAIFNAGSAGKCLSCAPLPGGAVAWWQAESNALDAVGPHDGTLQNGASFGVGRVGRAFSFDGVGAAVSVSDAPDLRFTSQFTLEAWVNPTNVSNNPMILSKFNGPNSSYELHLQPDGSLRANISGDGTTYDALTSGVTFLAAGGWSHVATTFNSGAWKLFINGVEVASKTSFVSTLFAGTANLMIGRDAGPTHFFSGLIDEPAVYNRALAAHEIAAIFNAGSAGKCSTPSLQATRAGAGQATISWTPNTPGFVLQESSSLLPSRWTNSTSGSTNPVTVPATVPAKFFRLTKP